MRDPALLLILLGFCALALHRPFLGVLGLALLGAMHPQAYADDWMLGFPVYRVLLAVTCLAVLVDGSRNRNWPRFRFDWRLGVLLLLFMQFVLSTWFALLPDAARARLFEMLLSLSALLLLYWLADSRRKLEQLVIVCAAGIALLALKGAFWALMTGFSDRVYGPPGSEIGDNNAFAVALAMAIPLLLLWRRQIAGRALRGVLVAAIALCYLAAIATWSRGGLVALAVMSALLVGFSRRRLLAVVLLATGVGLAVVSMPDDWLARMETIGAFAQDLSFRERQQAWALGLPYLKEDPWTGSGFEGWRVLTTTGPMAVGPAGRDWHSAYVQVAVGHGLPGLALWLLLLAGSLGGLLRLALRGARRGDAWARDYGSLPSAALAAWAVGGLTLATAYWELLFLVLAFGWIAIRLAGSAAPLAGTSSPPQGRSSLPAYGPGPQRRWSIVVASAVVLALLPFDLDAPLSAPEFALQSLPAHVYALLKPAILWAALGVVAGLGGLGGVARVGGLAAFALLLVTLPFVVPSPRPGDLIEVLGVLPGLALGLWLGERSTARHQVSGCFTESHPSGDASEVPVA